MKRRLFIHLLSFVLVSIFAVLFIGCSCNEEKKDPCTVTLDKTELNMVLGSTYEFTVKTTGESETPLSWSSSDSTIVSVTDGKIESISMGQAIITASYGDATATCTVNSGLGSLVPTLDFTTNDSEFVLTQGQVFEVAPKITFNGKNYDNYSIEVVGEKTILDYSVTEKTIKITANAVGEQTLMVKASWNGLTAETTSSLVKVIKIKVIADFYFSVNGGGVENIELYTCNSFEGLTYDKEINFDVSAIKNGVEIENADVDIQVVDQTIAKIDNGVLTALKSGTTAIKLSYADDETLYENTFNVKVVRPIAEYKKLFTAFSSINGMYKDLDNDGAQKSIITEVFGTDEIIDKFDGETELTIEDGKILGVKGEKDKAVQKTLVIGTAEYTYKINVVVYGAYITNAEDLTDVFGAANAKKDLDGYYVLANDIDASTADVDGGIRWDPIISGNTRARFRGTFDGKGHVISNLNLTGGSKTYGSLFGQLGSGANIKNVAFTNVLATKAGVIASNSYLDFSAKPQVSNVFVSINPETTNFNGVIIQGSAIINNVIVEYPNEETADGTASFSVGPFSGYDTSSANNYAISKTLEARYIPKGETELVTDYAFVTRFDSYDAMKGAELDFSSFDSEVWAVDNGVPAWKRLLTLSVSKNDLPVDGKIFLDNTTDQLKFDFISKFGTIVSATVTTSNPENLDIVGNTVKLKNEIVNAENNTSYMLTVQVEEGVFAGYSFEVEMFAEKSVVKDTKSRAYSIADGTLDLSDLPYSLTDVSKVEINGTQLNVTNGQLPAMSIVATDKNKLKLTVDGIAEPIIINKIETEKDFDPITIRTILGDGSVYDLTKVQVYSKVLMDADDLTEIFGSTGVLGGYYILGQDITANSSKNYYRTSHKFTGIFDGMGHVISNVNIKHGNGSLVSLFGELNNTGITAATIRNVAFVNLKASNGALVWNSADGANRENVVPSISNVYVSLSTNSTNFVGLLYNSSFVTINNCIVEDARTTTQDTTPTGSLVGTKSDKIKPASADNYVISKTPLCVGVEDSSITCAKRYNDLAGFKSAASGLDFSSFNYCWKIDNGIPVWKALSSN